MTDSELSPTEIQQSNQQIDALPPLRALVDSLDMKAHKSLGQNFLFDLNLTRRIARSARPLHGPLWGRRLGLAGWLLAGTLCTPF